MKDAVKFEVNFRGPVGSIKGPCLVLDPMEVRSCVPRVPWNVFLWLSMHTYDQ